MTNTERENKEMMVLAKLSFLGEVFSMNDEALVFSNNAEYGLSYIISDVVMELKDLFEKVETVKG